LPNYSAQKQRKEPEMKLLADQYPSEQEFVRLRVKIVFILLGIIWGAIIAYFAAGFFVKSILGGPIPVGLVGTVYVVLSCGIGAVLGGVIAYRLFKRSKYSK
jgi:hypothetical protein